MTDKQIMTDDLSPFADLLALQDEDLHADKLQYRIDHHPLAVEVAALHDRSVALDHSTAQIKEEYANHQARQEDIEGEIVDFETRIREIDEHLASDLSGSYRDQEAMSNELNGLSMRKRALEDQEIEIMELLEPIEAQLEQVKAQQLAFLDQARSLHQDMTREQGEIAKELQEVMAQREALASKVPAPLLAEYEKLRRRLGGIGAARLVHGMCSGCNLALSATEIERLRHVSPVDLVHCEQCGRILIP